VLKAAIVAAETRSALLGEKLVLPAGTVGTLLAPATTTWVGPLSYQDVLRSN
jgi:hypothetical protein